MRIEISGGIASGKTTLAKLLSERSNYELVLEQFRENPFWAKFYAHPSIWQEEKNFCFLIHHTGAIKAATQDAIVCDYAVFQDLAYADQSSTPGHAAMMQSLYRHLYTKLPPASLLVNLRCKPQTLLQRISFRGRPEEVGIKLEYLDKLNQAIESHLENYRGTVSIHNIDSDLNDFATDREIANRIINEILKIVVQLGQL
jgi:deoxyadenosine/deoxycytidine kinase